MKFEKRKYASIKITQNILLNTLKFIFKFHGMKQTHSAKLGSKNYNRGLSTCIAI